MIISYIKSECFKIFSQAKYKIIIAITLLANIFGVFVGMIPNSIINLSVTKYPYTVASALAYIVIPFVAFLLASNLIAGECERNQIKLLVTRHIERSIILLGKLAAICIYLAVILALNIILSAILGMIFSGFGTISLIKVFSAFLITLIPLFTIVSFSGFIAVNCKSSSSSLGLSIVGYAGFILIGLLFSGLSKIFFTSYTTIFKMIIGNNIPWLSLISGLSVLLCWILILLSLSCLKFERKEF